LVRHDSSQSTRGCYVLLFTEPETTELNLTARLGNPYCELAESHVVALNYKGSK